MALALIAAETLGLGAPWSWTAVAAFWIGRVLHAIRYDHADRGVGMLLTNLSQAGLGGYVLVALVRG